MKLPIPDAALDDRLFFGGTAGSGKTYNAMSRVERLLNRHSRVVIPDPLGVWWGLRLSADGKKPSGYDVVIFGGPHCDLPLTEAAGALIGETVAGMKESCILDLSQLGTKASERRFMLAFLTALYKHTPGEPLHVIFDEADMWAPQKLLDKDGDAARLLGMMETLVRRGRVKGFIPWLISQRPAVVTKDILSQADGIVAFKLTSSQDRKAIEAWVEGQADKKTWDTISAQLPTMERGQGLVWIPGRGVLETVQFPEKETFDSSRTPKRGERLKRTAALKPIDLGAVKNRLVAVEAELKASDPTALRAENAKLKTEKAALEKQLTLKSTTPAKPDKDAIGAAEKRGLDRGQKAAVAAAEKTIRSLRTALEAAMKFIIEINAKDFFKAGGDAIDKKAVEKAIADATGHITRMIEAHLGRRDKQIEGLQAEAKRVLAKLKSIADQDVTVKVDVQHNKAFTIVPGGGQAPPAPPRSRAAAIAGDGTLTGPMRQCLQALAWWSAMGHQAPTRAQVAAICGWKSKGSNLRNRLAELSSAGLIAYPQSGVIQLTEAGAAAAPSPDTGTTLVESIRSACTGPMLALFDAMLAFHNDGVTDVTRDMIGERVGWEANGSNLRNRLAELSAIEVIAYPRKGIVELQGWVTEDLRAAA